MRTRTYTVVADVIAVILTPIIMTGTLNPLFEPDISVSGGNSSGSYDHNIRPLNNHNTPSPWLNASTVIREKDGPISHLNTTPVFYALT